MSTRPGALRFTSIPLLLAWAASCASSGARGESGLEQVNELLVKVGAVEGDAVSSRDRAREGLDALQAILDRSFEGDAALALRRLNTSVERSEDRTQKFKERVPRMRRLSTEFFANWSRDIAMMTSEALSERSERDRRAALELYREVAEATAPVQGALDAFNARLRDASMYLGRTFTASALQALSGEAEALGAEYDAVEQAVQELVEASRRYQEHSAPLQAQAE